MEQRRRRNPAEEQLSELIKEQSQPEAPTPSDKSLTPGKGAHVQPLPDGGHMIIQDGFNV